MYIHGMQLIYALICFFLVRATADKTTEVVSITSTTTVHVTATDYSGACDNFVGACVVYGSPYGSAPYTTTVYRYAPTPTPPPTTTVLTSTTVIYATTTVSNSGACSGFRGACVVYATAGNGAGTSTVYYAGSSAAPAAAPQPGNGQGYIGPKEADGGDGAIGEAPGIQRWTLFAVLGSAVICAMLLL